MYPRFFSHPIIDYFKPRIVVMQLITVSLGFILGQGSGYTALILLNIGTFFISAGSAALNNAIEKEYDKRMERTKNRILPSNGMPLQMGYFLGVFFAVLGFLMLWNVNPQTGVIGAITVITYVAVYTPLKRVTWLNTFIGAVPGALPPLGGYVAAAGQVDALGWSVFALLFFWQIPHFYAIAWMYKEDYKLGGFKMLPFNSESPKIMAWIMIVFAVLMNVAALYPFCMNGSKTALIMIVILGALGINFLRKIGLFLKEPSYATAKKVLLDSVKYIPIYLILVIIL